MWRRIYGISIADPINLAATDEDVLIDLLSLKTARDAELNEGGESVWMRADGEAIMQKEKAWSQSATVQKTLRELRDNWIQSRPGRPARRRAVAPRPKVKVVRARLKPVEP